MISPLPLKMDPVGWSLLLVGSDMTGGTRRLRLVGDDLEEFVPRAAQSVSICVMRRGAPLRRICSIDGFDREELRLDLTLPVEGDEEAEAWASAAEIGDSVVVELGRFEPKAAQNL